MAGLEIVKESKKRKRKISRPDQLAELEVGLGAIEEPRKKKKKREKTTQSPVEAPTALPSAALRIHPATSVPSRPFPQLPASLPTLPQTRSIPVQRSPAPALVVPKALPKAKKHKKQKSSIVVAAPPAPGESSAAHVGSTDFQEQLVSKWLRPAELKALEEQAGLTSLKGKWTAAEDQAIEAYFKTCCEKENISKDQLVRDYVLGKKQGDFWQSAARSVPGRPLQAVYLHIRRAYAPKQGAWTEEGDQTLREALEEHGSRNWTKAAELTGRAATHCRDRWRQIALADDGKKGQWSAAEELKLAKAIRKVTKKHGKMSSTNSTGKKVDSVRWDLVSKKVEGRTAAQCREKWEESLKLKLLRHQGLGSWGRAEDDSFVTALISLKGTGAQIKTLDWTALARSDPLLKHYSSKALLRKWHQRASVHSSAPQDFDNLVDKIASDHTAAKANTKRVLKKANPEVDELDEASMVIPSLEEYLSSVSTEQRAASAGRALPKGKFKSKEFIDTSDEDT